MKHMGYTTKVFCDQIWDGGMIMTLPRLEEEEEIHLSMTVTSFGEIEGWFNIQKVKHTYDGEGRTGYTQHVYVQPKDLS
jgi:hypothetical protein